MPDSSIIIMLNLFSLKEKKEEGAKGAGTKKKASAAQLRITKVWPSLLYYTTVLFYGLFLCRILTSWNFLKPAKQNFQIQTISLVSS